MNHLIYAPFRQGASRMIYVLLAKIFDPVVIVLGLIGGRLSRNWAHVAVLALMIAVIGETIVGNGYETLLLSGLSAGVWTSIGFLLRWRKSKRNLEGREALAQNPSINATSQIALRKHLGKMIKWMEAIELTRLTMPIGAGGGIDSLPRDRQTHAVRELEAGMSALAKYPSHVITAELMSNRQSALEMGRHVRAAAIARLLDHLTEQKVALSTEEFIKPYV